ncbi:MAG: ribonuclease Z, partial [Archaeoglobaceae archaeon]|nr:ribonuclease Z [Archaeoglobaceae archaeon]MDW8118301.1 ribonuclease Z [Archaeoglobaceae archaeon]
GTAGTIPSADRNTSAIFVQHSNYRFLFDCGEGTQRQIMSAKLGFRNLDNVFITHMHTDHFIGAFGLIETLSLNGRKKELNFYTPNPEMLKTLFEIFGYDKLDYPIIVKKAKGGDEINFRGFKIVVFETEHIVPSVGYALIENDFRKFEKEKALALGIPPGPIYAKLKSGESIEWEGKLIIPEMVLGEVKKGRRLVYTGDTRPCERTVEIAMNADLLIHDASFSEEMKEWAIESGHSTAREAGEVAKKANVRKLILTHISARYSKDPEILLKEAKEVFEDVEIANDFFELNLI